MFEKEPVLAITTHSSFRSLSVVIWTSLYISRKKSQVNAHFAVYPTTHECIAWNALLRPSTVDHYRSMIPSVEFNYCLCPVIDHKMVCDRLWSDVTTGSNYRRRIEQVCRSSSPDFPTQIHDKKSWWWRGKALRDITIFCIRSIAIG